MTAESAAAPDFAPILRRVGAFVIDYLILGVFFAVLSLPLGGLFYAMGQEARWLGLAVALVYFGLGYSEVLGGQTVGKRLLKIRTIGPGGAPVPLRTAFLRAALWWIPLFMNGYKMPFQDSLTLFSALWAMLWASLVLGSIIFLLANSASRQSFHDLFAGTYVVRATKDPALFACTSPSPSAPKWAAGSMATLLLLALLGYMAGKGKVSELLDLREDLTAAVPTADFQVYDSRTIFAGDTTHTLKIVLVTSDDPHPSVEEDPRTQTVLETARAHETYYNTFNEITITYLRQFNTLFYSGSKSEGWKWNI